MAKDPDETSSKQAQDMESFIRGIPKAELHMHLEGSLEPAMLFQLPQRNNIPLRWTSPAQLQAAYNNLTDLDSFLALFSEGCKVLVTRQDFYDVTFAYLSKAHEQNVVRAEMFLGPQSFTSKGTGLEDVLEGTLDAIEAAERELGISGALIVDTHRGRSESEALAMLDALKPWRARIVGIGMGGAELPHPPSKFVNYFAACRAQGFKTCIHAGEEGPADYVRQAVELLHVDRVDHGIACASDAALVAHLAAKRIPLTVCPVSNLKLHVVEDLERHPIRALLKAGVRVSMNSDDPPYFGAYVNENFIMCQEQGGLTKGEVVALARNSILGAFLLETEKERLLARLEKYCRDHETKL